MPEMTWWGWLLVAVFAWIGADVLFVALFSLRRRSGPFEHRRAR
jgi:hypothetical protein